MRDWLIVEIAPQKKKRDRVNVYFSDFVLGISLFLLTKHGLTAGDKLSEKKLVAFWKEEIEERTTNKALFLLSYRPRSEKEMEQRLKMYLKKSEPTLKKAPYFLQIKTNQVIKKVIGILKKRKLIDDCEFAAWWCEQRARFRPRSLLQLRMELGGKGISKEIIDEALLKSGYDEEKMAKKLVEKKLSGLKGEGKEKRLIAYLTRKGFSYKLVKSLIDEKRSLA